MGAALAIAFPAFLAYNMTRDKDDDRAPPEPRDPQPHPHSGATHERDMNALIAWSQR